MKFFKIHRTGKKGFIFSLDALFAVVLLLLLFASLFLHYSKADNQIVKTYLTRQGSDVVRALENNGVITGIDLDGLDEIPEDVEEVLDTLTSDNMRFNLTYSDVNLEQKVSLAFGGNASSNDFVGTGKRFFVAESEEEIVAFGVITYWTWKK